MVTHIASDHLTEKKNRKYFEITISIQFFCFNDSMSPIAENYWYGTGICTYDTCLSVYESINLTNPFSNRELYDIIILTRYGTLFFMELFFFNLRTLK